MSLKKDTTTHIFDHIHEWRRQRHLIKFEIVDQLLTDGLPGHLSAKFLRT